MQVTWKASYEKAGQKIRELNTTNQEFYNCKCRNGDEITHEEYRQQIHARDQRK